MLQSQIEQETQEPKNDDKESLTTTTQLLLVPLQGLGSTSAEQQQDNLHFLIHDLYPAFREIVSKTTTTTSTNTTENKETILNEITMCQSLAPTALCLVQEILADVVLYPPQKQEPQQEGPSLRATVGTTVLPLLIQDLVYYYDTVQIRFVGRPAKEIVLTPMEQRIFVSIVRLLGNLVYGCRSNQDLLRNTVAPPTNDSSSQQQQPQQQQRTGLHLILSCTSLSHTCFTLREWSIVAIRNALDNNIDNQTMVAQLQAQQPAPSAPLEEMGVRVQLEQNGKVSLKPVSEDE
jgi:hypothetical protein